MQHQHLGCLMRIVTAVARRRLCRIPHRTTSPFNASVRERTDRLHHAPCGIAGRVRDVLRATTLRVDAESEHDGNTAHSFENTRTVCHHAPRATHVDRPAARAHNETCRSPPDSSRKCLPRGLNRSVPRAGITFALCLHERSAYCAIGHRPTRPERRRADRLRRHDEVDTRTRHHLEDPHARCSPFRSQTCARGHARAGRVTGSGSGSRRTINPRRSDGEGAGNVGHAVRDATAVGHRTGSVLVRQPVPVREAVRRMERHPSRRRRLPGRRRSQVRHRLRQGTDVGRSGSTPPQPRRPHSTRSVQHQGLRPSQCRRERTQSWWLARRRWRVRSVLRVPAGGLLRPWHGQPRVEPDQLPPGRN